MNYNIINPLASTHDGPVITEAQLPKIHKYLVEFTVYYTVYYEEFDVDASEMIFATDQVNAINLAIKDVIADKYDIIGLNESEIVKIVCTNVEQIDPHF